MSDSKIAGIGEVFHEKLTGVKEFKINDVLDVVTHSEEAYHKHALKKL
jgi:hypothetical protein